MTIERSDVFVGQCGKRGQTLREVHLHPPLRRIARRPTIMKMISIIIRIVIMTIATFMIVIVAVTVPCVRVEALHFFGAEARRAKRAHDTVRPLIEGETKTLG